MRLATTKGTIAALALSLLGTAGAVQARSAVYIATNDAGGNAVMVFNRNALGKLDETPTMVPTEGLGTGGGLGNQSGVLLSQDGRYLFVVNAGSDEISTFALNGNGLTLVGNTPSGGQQPVSITQDRNLLYVLNAGGGAGGADNIAGFYLRNDGSLRAIPGSTQPLSADSTGPAQVGFTPDGSALVVTEKGTNTIDTYMIDFWGRAGFPLSQPAAGQTPFGFSFGKRGQLFVSEAYAGVPDGSVVSSYHVAEDGFLEDLSPNTATNETAACWVVISPDNRFAFASNTGSGTISVFSVGFDGSLDLLKEDGISATIGAGTAPIDIGLSGDGRNLYVLNSGNASLSVFAVNPFGGVFPVQTITGLPAGSNGLMVR